LNARLAAERFTIGSPFFTDGEPKSFIWQEFHALEVNRVAVQMEHRSPEAVGEEQDINEKEKKSS
jgi:hypothetical protein